MAYGPPAGAPDSSIALVEGPWTHRVVPANGITVHIAELGTGPLVLLLHGFPQFWWAWRHQLIDLADAGYRCVAVDLRGYGASDKPPRGYDTPTLARDMAPLVTRSARPTRWSRAPTSADARLDDGGRHPRVVRSLAIVGAAHPLRMRHVLARSRAQRVASRYALRTFQVPRRPEHLLARDGDYVRSLFDRWTGPRWRGTPGYVADVDRYAAAMRIHPVAYCAAEYFRWLVRSLLRPDGRRYAAALASPIGTAGAAAARRPRQLRAAVHRARLGQYVTGEYEWRVLGRRRALPAQRGARTRQRRVDALGEAALTGVPGRLSQPHNCPSPPDCPACTPAVASPPISSSVSAYPVSDESSAVANTIPTPCRRRRPAGRRSCRCARRPAPRTPRASRCWRRRCRCPVTSNLERIRDGTAR